jgi:hypothetical protein
MQNPLIKKFIIKTTLFLIGVFLILACVHLIPVDKNQYLAAIIDKHQALESTPGARLIAVGGSNVAYGFDSQQLAKMINRPVINMGLHAYLGLKFMLSDLYPYIHPGDIILIVPEYLQFYNNYFEGYGYKLAEMLDTYPAGIRSMDAYQIISVLKDYVPLLRSKIYRASASVEINPLYNRHLFDQYGDIKHKIKSTTQATVRNIPYVNKSDKYDLNAAMFLNDFEKKVKTKGASLILLYPAGRKTNCEETGSRLEILDQELREILDFPILSSPFDACMGDGYFLDTEYHLNNLGTELRMKMIGDLLISLGFVNG